MQDEIVARLANQLGAQLVAAEARRVEHAPNPDSIDLFFQGMSCINKGWTAQHVTQASDFFERSVRREPTNVDALVGTAFANYLWCMTYLADDPAALLAAAETLLTKALSLAPEHALAHLCLGRVQILKGNAIGGIAECERALALNRNLASAHANIGVAKISIGRAEEAEAHIQEAFRLSPKDTNANIWMAVLGCSMLFLGKDDEAVRLLRNAIEINRNYPNAHFWLAAALAHLGRANEARTATQAGLALSPTFTISRFREGAWSDNQTYLAQRERVYRRRNRPLQNGVSQRPR